MTKRPLEVLEEQSVPNDFLGLPAMLRSGQFSDVTVELGDEQFRAHRVLLASQSEVLRVQFEGSWRDDRHFWRPDCGSPAAWRWIIAWIYGDQPPLPLEHLVELLVVADRFQMHALLRKLQALELDAEKGTEQLLAVDTVPKALEQMARRCLQQVTFSKSLLERIMKAPRANVVMLLQHVRLSPLDEVFDQEVLEECRLRFLGECCQDGLPDLLDGIRWEVFSSDLLRLAHMGDLTYFERLLRQTWRPQRMQEVWLEALALRCANLEAQLKAPSDLKTGLFAKLLEKGVEMQISLSSSLSCMSAYPLHVLLAPNKKVYGTRSQSTTDPPWIELGAPQVLIDVHSVALQHGWSDNGHRCRAFVLEACRDEEPWRKLIEKENWPLRDDGEVLPVPRTAESKVYNRFRIRMTGPTASYSWHLMMSWFEIFGQVVAYSGPEGIAIQKWSEFVPGTGNSWKSHPKDVT